MRKSIFVAALIVVLAPAAALPQAKSGKGGVYEQLNLFGEAFERIRHDAVEAVADKKLIETAISGMLNSLDPRSVYLNETEYKALQTPTTDQSGSTGLVVTLDNGQVKVVAPRAGSPAADAAIKPGDIIFTIDKDPTYDLTLPEIEQKLRGADGSEVALMVRRGAGTPIEVKVKRAAGPFPTVTSRLEAGDIGYIRLAGFDDRTAAAVDAAVAAADAFIDKGDITIVKSRKADSAKRIAATPGDVANGQPIVALVNGGTAREAELVAGALQDSQRAVLLGSKTFGEAAIETLIPLNGNGAIRLTTARFVTPSGRPIQGKGLEPDLTVSPLKLEKVAQADRRREADLRGALKNPDTVKAAGKGGAAPPADASTPEKSTNTTASPPKGDQPTIPSGDIGTTSDEQLSQAVDVLRGLALVSGRTASSAR